MPTTDQIRIEQDRARPRILLLWWALRPLTSVIRFMQTGAHPDDEISGMLAALTFRDGFNLSYACSTRGEGGQNDLGTEAGRALGALRTREMERACDVLGMRMYWLSETPEDTISDFGFSKSGTETLGLWGRERTLARFVDIIREERPDIICPTFLDVPGQHGHHRAMTETATEVMTAAADPGFPSNRTPWQVAKLYLPAWSGAGQAYDDDLPPPPETVNIDGSGSDPVSGWGWNRIGQQSRAFHRTQGMGRWEPAARTGNWPLHLARTSVPGPDAHLSSGLSVTLRDLARLPGAENMSEALITAQDAIDDAIAAFPDVERTGDAAFEALRAVRRAREACPDALRDNVVHRLDAKEVQLGHVIRLALGVEAHCHTAGEFLVPGRETGLNVAAVKGNADEIQMSFDLPEGWTVAGNALRINDDVVPGEPYRITYDPALPAAPACELQMTKGATVAMARVPFDVPPVILPRHMARVLPDAALVNLAGEGRAVEVRIEGVCPAGAAPSFDLPEGWGSGCTDNGIVLLPKEGLATGRYFLPVRVDDVPAQSVQRIRYPHTDPTSMTTGAGCHVLVLDAEVPQVRIGYVGAGNDRVDHWLSVLGADVTDLSAAELENESVINRFDTIVIGIFAMRFHDRLAEVMPHVHRWVEAGGTLVTLYHRPWDNWDPLRTPPLRLEIGQPSLRWRVTDAGADVTQLADHPVLRTPNRIGKEDWDGWVKERGLYFAKSWDATYTPLLRMSDPGEDALDGALLVADVGAGRHVHTSLILHHQMENLVPGAFRLMANLVARRE